MMMQTSRLRQACVAAMLGLLMTASAVSIDAQDQKPATTGSAAAKTKEKTDDDLKVEWQRRVAEAKKQLAEAQARKFQLQQKRDTLKVEWAVPGSARTNEMIDADLGKTEAELAEAQKAIDDAKDLLENVIPDEARKAGVPPGWARD